jgi:hypothetical protein
MACAHFASSTYSLHLFGQVIPGYAAFFAVIVNIAVTVVFSLIFNLWGWPKAPIEPPQPTMRHPMWSRFPLPPCDSRP